MKLIKSKVTIMLLGLVHLNVIGADDESQSNTYELDPVYIFSKKIKVEQQKTSDNITVLSNSDIEKKNIGNVYEAILSLPNFYMVKAGNGSDAGFVTMRGINPGMEGDQAVGFFVDGVYSKSFDSELFDVERIEVLHGAQSTLYGRNAEVGAVVIKTKDPIFSPEYQFNLSYGSFNQSLISAILNNSLGSGDQAAYRLALKYLSSNSYLTQSNSKKKDVDHIREFDGRIKLRLQPLNSHWNIVSMLDFQRSRNGNTSFNELDKAMSGSTKVDSDYIGKINVDSHKAQITATREFDNMDLTSISAYSQEKKIDNQDLDFTSHPVMNLLMNFKNKQYSQELRLNSKNDSKFSWLVGASYLHTDSNSVMDMVYLPYSASSYRDSTIKINNYAFFANVGYYLTDKVELSVGSRYDYEKKHMDFYINDQLSGMAPQRLSDDKSFKSFLPKVGINYHLSDNIMLYGNVYRGYKSGGFNILNSGFNRSFNSEYSTNYEIGLKTEFNKTLRWNTSLFLIHLKDQQVEVANYPISYTVNSGKSVSKGLETELLWKITPAFTASVNVGYTDARYKDFPTKIKVGSNQFQNVNYKNNRPANVPNYTYNVALDYNFNNGYFIRADYHAKGQIYLDNANTKKNPSVGLLDVAAGYNGRNHSVKLWAKNVLNKKYVTRAFKMDNGTWYARPGKPKSLGVSVNYKF